MTEALFVQEGGCFVPTGIGVSPWTGKTIGGVPLAALSAHLMNGLPAPAGVMHPARFAIDIFGAVPMAPLEGEARIVRDGRRVQLLEAELRSGGRTWARATMLRVREDATPPGDAPLTRPLPGADAPQQRSELCDAVQIGERGQGKGARWVNFRPDTVAGEPLSPIERAVMIADFGSGIAPLFSMDEWTFANLDITLYLARLPRGEWLLIDAVSESAGNGVGLAHGLLGDRDGMFGRSTQTVFLAQR